MKVLLIFGAFYVNCVYPLTGTYLVVLMGQVHQSVGVRDGVGGGQVGESVEDEQRAEVDGVDDLDELVVGLVGEEHLLVLVLQDAVVGGAQVGRVGHAAADGREVVAGVLVEVVLQGVAEGLLKGYVARLGEGLLKFPEIDDGKVTGYL